jgi:uncharacterized membrane protein YkoI
MTTRLLLHLATLLLALCVSGCGASPQRDEYLTADETPAAVTAAAEKVFPGMAFEQIWKYEENGEIRYELRGKTADRQVHEVTVSADGKVLWPVQPE